MTKIETRPLLLCFSHLRWGFVWQRPQHLLSRAAAHYRVVFFEEAYFGPEVTQPFLYCAPSEHGVEIIVPHLPASFSAHRANEAVRDLLDECLIELCDEPALLWYYTPAALAFSDHLDSPLCVYDCMDQLSAFKDAPADLAQQERALLRRADLLFCGGRMLFENKRDHHTAAHLFPSSIEAENFARARRIAAVRAKNPEPVLGFFGVIDERLDLALVEAIASLRPEWRLEMIGPVAKIDPQTLPLRPNIVWRGPCPYAELPDHLATWDIGFMPFALNEATRFISPTKTPEFLAAGLPVVSTPIRDVVMPYGEAGLVEIACDANECVQAVEHLLQAPRDTWLAEVDAFLSATSWDRTWTAMHTLMLGRLQSNAAVMLQA